MAPYQKGGLFSFFSGGDYDQAKKRLNIKEYKIFLKKKDFQNYDTKFFKALLPLLNKNRTEFSVPPGKIPVPNALKDVIKDKFFIVEEKPQPTSDKDPADLSVSETFTPRTKKPERSDNLANIHGENMLATRKKIFKGKKDRNEHISSIPCIVPKPDIEQFAAVCQELKQHFPESLGGFGGGAGEQLFSSVRLGLYNAPENCVLSRAGLNYPDLTNDPSPRLNAVKEYLKKVYFLRVRFQILDLVVRLDLFGKDIPVVSGNPDETPVNLEEVPDQDGFHRNYAQEQQARAERERQERERQERENPD
ncbi:14305_t:CDS:2 [Funneliformis geosporum]|nr:14305_t:CDS:2 [Funneliformis geosporum]